VSATTNALTAATPNVIEAVPAVRIVPRLPRSLGIETAAIGRSDRILCPIGPKQERLEQSDAHPSSFDEMP